MLSTRSEPFLNGKLPTIWDVHSVLASFCEPALRTRRSDVIVVWG